MTITKIEIRPGAYYDSVVLMHLQRALVELPEVKDAGVVMATPANCELLIEGGLYPAEAQAAKSDDLLLVVKAATEDDAQNALARVDELIAARRSKASQTGLRPRSIPSALKSLPEARWLLVSVPGRYAAGVARQGLEAGLNVFLYSDNVSLEEEVELKKFAGERGLLVMGPDCGTAIVSGVGLGFANRVRRGEIGLVGASGTGLQAITSAIHRLGAGISHAFGTGGRDLKAEVEGITALQSLYCLAQEPETAVIVLVSKPPNPEVAARLLGAARACGKPVVVNFIGYPAPEQRLGNLQFAPNLQEAARIAVGQTGGQPVLSPTGDLDGRYLRGLFSGGTLAVETVLALQNLLFPLYTNVPVSAHQALENPMHSRAHTIVDLGEDEFTQGRLHPMMDNDLRIRRLRQELADPETGMILLDVVLGEGAHPDPAAELAPEVEKATAYGITVVVMVIGTDEDPQDMEKQIHAFQQAGAAVFGSVSEAVSKLAEMVPPPGESGPELKFPDPEMLIGPLAAVNVGLESFYESLASQGAEAVHVDWRPPAGGDEKLAGILAKLKSSA